MHPTPPWQSETEIFEGKEKESVMDYLAVLKKMMATCKYGQVEYNDQLRDRLLHGCHDADMQTEIIKVGEDLTLDTAIKAALMYEARQKSLKEMADQQHTQGASVSVSTNRVNSQQSRCWRCNGWHSSEVCKFRNETCHGCSKRGHIKSRSPDWKPQQSKSGSQNKGYQRSGG